MWYDRGWISLAAAVLLLQTLHGPYELILALHVSLNLFDAVKPRSTSFAEENEHGCSIVRLYQTGHILERILLGCDGEFSGCHDARIVQASIFGEIDSHRAALFAKGIEADDNRLVLLGQGDTS